MPISNTTAFTKKMRFLSPLGNVTITDKTASTVPTAADEEDRRSFDEGVQAGLAQAQKKNAPILASQKAKIEDLQAQIAHLRDEMPQAFNDCLVELGRQAEEEAVELAFSAAEVIIRREISRQTPVRAILTEALRKLTHLNEVKLMLSPSDYRALAAEPGSVPPGIALVQDAQLMTGEIFVESPQGFLDGKVQTRLNELRTQFIDLLNEAESDNDQDA